MKSLVDINNDIKNIVEYSFKKEIDSIIKNHKHLSFYRLKVLSDKMSILVKALNASIAKHINEKGCIDNFNVQHALFNASVAGFNVMTDNKVIDAADIAISAQVYAGKSPELSSDMEAAYARIEKELGVYADNPSFNMHSSDINRYLLEEKSPFLDISLKRVMNHLDSLELQAHYADSFEVSSREKNQIHDVKKILSEVGKGWINCSSVYIGENKASPNYLQSVSDFINREKKYYTNCDKLVIKLSCEMDALAENIGFEQRELVIKDLFFLCLVDNSLGGKSLGNSLSELESLGFPSGSKEKIIKYVDSQILDRSNSNVENAIDSNISRV